MPKYILNFYGQKCTITANSPEEARKEAARKLSKISGLRIPPSALSVWKRTIAP